jgi:hypothetical protein
MALTGERSEPVRLGVRDNHACLFKRQEWHAAP